MLGEHRLPLGVWATDIVARAGLHPIINQHKQRDFADKESHRWLAGYEQACALAAAAPQVQIISVSDREGDVYEVFAEAARRAAAHEPAAQWVIRCCQKERSLQADPAQAGALKLAAQVAQSPVLGTVAFKMGGKTQTKKARGQTTQVERHGRLVTQEIRACQLHLKPPFRKGRRLPPVAIWAVSARELNPPAGQEPIDWLILTDLPVTTFAQAQDILEIYLARWEVEVFHRVLKTGCTVEELQLKAPARLLPALALYMIVAWRLLYLTKLGRDCPELPCDVVFEAAEWKALVTIAGGRQAVVNQPSLGVMIRLIAQHGGYLGRKGDGPPGPQVMWQGLRSLQNFALAWRAFGPPESS